MIEYIEGILYKSNEHYIIIDNQGLGYKVYITKGLFDKLPPIGQTLKVDTYLSHKENAMELYGFLDSLEKTIFEELIKVSGVGNKLALKILSALSPEDIISNITNKDKDSLKQLVSGLGDKTAQKIIIELSTKFKKLYSSLDAEYKDKHQNQDAFDALRSLGYKENEVRKVLHEVINNMNNTKSTEEIVREALIYFSKK